ncbi:MAG: hypothetical protein ACLUUF_06055 [Bifidobacterium pullorum]
MGNRIGVALDDSIAVDDLFAPAYGSFIVELAPSANMPTVSNLVEIGPIGETTADYVFHAAGETLDLRESAGGVGERHCIGVPYRSGETDAEAEARSTRSRSRRWNRPCTRVRKSPSRA